VRCISRGNRRSHKKENEGQFKYRRAKGRAHGTGRLFGGFLQSPLHFNDMLCGVFFMRFPRVEVEGQSFYHCISRVVEGRFIFGTSEGG
jgi:hypothetical protein